MSQAPTLAAEDELERAFPGSALTHVLTVATADPLTVAAKVLAVVGAAGGQLQALHLTRLPESNHHQLRLSGLSARDARLLANRIAGMPGVTRASVEHQLLRAPDRRSTSQAQGTRQRPRLNLEPA